MSRIEQTTSLIDRENVNIQDEAEILDVDSDYHASAYDYDTSSEVESVKSKDSRSSISRKQFKPSTKKKIQLTFENLTVKTLSHRKKLLCIEYGETSKSKKILDQISGTFVPGQFTAILGASGKILKYLILVHRFWQNNILKLFVRPHPGVEQSIANDW